MAEQTGDTPLKLDDRRIFGIYVIADRRGQHGLTHLLGRLGHGVRAQIDHGEESDELPKVLDRRVPPAQSAQQVLMTSRGRGPLVRSRRLIIWPGALRQA